MKTRYMFQICENNMTIKYTWSNTSPWRQNKFFRRYIALNVRSQKLNSVYNY